MKNIFFALFALFAFSESAAQATKLCSKGTIVDYKYKYAVKGVRVELKSNCGQIIVDSTDMHGYYYFENITPCDTYSISFIRNSFDCHDGYQFEKKVLTNIQFLKLDTTKLFPVERDIRIPTIYFEENSANIKNVLIQFDEENKKLYIDSAFKYSIDENLKSFAEYIKCNHRFNIVLYGYSSCNEKEAKDLAFERATAVKNYLMRSGVNPALIKIDTSNLVKYTDQEIKKTKNGTEKKLKIMSNQQVEISLPPRCSN